MKSQKTKGVKLRELAPCELETRGAFSRYDEFFNLLLNSVEIGLVGGGKIPYAQEIFAKKALFEEGAVGFDCITQNFRYVYGEGVNDYGNPTSLRLVTANGRAYTRLASYAPKEDGAYIITAMPYGSTMSELIKQTTDFMTNCDIAMQQNLNACKTPYVLVCKSEEMLLSYKQALQQQQDGQAVILVNSELGDGLKSVDIGVPFLVDKFAMVRDTERDTLLNKLGILTANTDKRERVQSAEVNATIGQASDYIYMLIDTFNKQCETYGLPFEMRLNGSLEELYESEDGTANQPNELEKEQTAQAEEGQEKND